MTFEDPQSSANVLLEWGRLFLHGQNQNQDRLDKLAQKALSAPDMAESLRDDLDTVIADARHAFTVLRSADILDLSEDDQAWGEALDAFASLDRVVYLMEAVDRVVGLQDRNLANELLLPLSKVYEQGAEMFFSSAFSPLRLTVFQNQRIAALETIAPQYHYLFPWYERHHEAPPDILHLLADHWYLLEQPEILPEEHRVDLLFFKAEIQQDMALLQHVADQSRMAHTISATFSANWPLRLWRAVLALDRDQNTSKLPGLSETDIAKRTLAILYHPPVTPLDRLALVVASACFARGLDDAERCQFLLECEQQLDRLDAFSDSNSQPEQLIQSLHQFKTGNISPHDAAQAALDFWITTLLAVDISAPLSTGPANTSELLKALIAHQAEEPIQAKPPLPKPVHAAPNWLDTIRNWLFTPTHLVPAMIALLILLTLPTFYLLRAPVPFQVDMTLLAYKAAPPTRSDQDETVLTLQSGATLSAQDCFQLQFTATKDVYAYLLHQNTQGMITKYFQGPLIAGNMYQFPEGEMRACFTEEYGEEVFYLVLFEGRNDEFEVSVKSQAYNEKIEYKNSINDFIIFNFQPLDIKVFSFKYR